MQRIFLPLILLFVFQLQGTAQNLETGLIAHWGFNNDSPNTVLDESGNGINGTSYEIDHTAGVKGSAILFNSVHDGVFFPDLNRDAPPQIGELSAGSISVWFNFQNVGGQILPVLYFGESSENEPHNSLIIEIGHGPNEGDPNNRRLYFTMVKQRFCFDSRENLKPNFWYHFVAVVDSTGNTGYLNGEELMNRNYNLGSNSTYHNFFSDIETSEVLSLGYGRFGQNDRFFHFKGKIDEVRIYNRPLTPEEVGLLWDEGKKYAGVPDKKDVSYGSSDRNILDFWQAESAEPTPLVVFIHGGGFKSGSKENAYLPDIQQCLDNGISFAAINYRYRQTTRLDTIMYDCARAIQFLRSRAAEWNIDKNRVAAYGGSAGGGAALWLGVTDDLANPTATGAVLRESSRLQVIGHQVSQASYDFETWAEIVQVPENWMDIYPNSEDLELYHIESRDRYNDAEIVELRKLLDMPAHIDENDPPIYLRNLNPLDSPTSSGEIIHHPNHAIYLKNKFDEKKVDAYLLTQKTPTENRKNVIDYFIEKFAEIETGANLFPNNRLDIYPNPACNYLKIRTGNRIRQVTIYTIGGRKIHTSNSRSPTHLIDVSNWPNGIYFVKTDSGETAKLIISN